VLEPAARLRNYRAADQTDHNMHMHMEGAGSSQPDLCRAARHLQFARRMRRGKQLFGHGKSVDAERCDSTRIGLLCSLIRLALKREYTKCAAVLIDQVAPRVSATVAGMCSASSASFGGVGGGPRWRRPIVGRTGAGVAATGLALAPP
jgi:hypothetical protein